jgi:hypothetical protein
MKIELKNVKYAAFASDETHCFEATIYIDGKRAATVSNDGHGGPDEIVPHQIADKINDYAKTLPPSDYEGMSIPETAETIIGDLMNSWLEQKENRRLCRKYVCFRSHSKTYADGVWDAIKGKLTPEIKIWLQRKYGANVRILNEEIAA